MNSSLKKVGAGAAAALLADTALDIGGLGIVGGGIAIGIPALALVSGAIILGAGICAYVCVDDNEPKSTTDF